MPKVRYSETLINNRREQDAAAQVAIRIHTNTLPHNPALFSCWHSRAELSTKLQFQMQRGFWPELWWELGWALELLEKDFRNSIENHLTQEKEQFHKSHLFFRTTEGRMWAQTVWLQAQGCCSDLSEIQLLVQYQPSSLLSGILQM